MEKTIANIVMQLTPPIELRNKEAILEWRLEKAVAYTFGWCIAKNFTTHKNW